MTNKNTIGLYESVITKSLFDDLQKIANELSIKKKKYKSEDVGDRLGLHISKAFNRALASVDDKKRVEVGLELTRKIINLLSIELNKSGVGVDTPCEESEFLQAILPLNIDGDFREFEIPMTPLLDTVLLTNAVQEPRIQNQLLSEIDSADRIDIVMAFVRMSGIRPFINQLKKHCAKDGGIKNLRVLTTTYTGSTELRALEELKSLGADIKISYDHNETRLHAKAWYFYRNSGSSTAYIGSSNLTYSAQVSGMEWNVRVSGMRNPDVLRKVESVFEHYWSGGDFKYFDSKEFEENSILLVKNNNEFQLPNLEIILKPFQERLLEKINLSRKKGNNRNLLVSATGTGKTVMAAVDYLRLTERLPRARLLFVAHRKEILEQSLKTFRIAVGSSSFGELWVGGHKPTSFENVFASIQSLNSVGYESWDPDYFDVVVVDEFHHAEAESYKKLLDHIKPKELLGLTATPERSDGLPVLDFFNGKIAAELRLWDAIDQNRLVPFHYYGINDETDLREIPWRRSGGYHINDLSNFYVSNTELTKLILRELRNKVDDINNIKCLGFCVSVEHAKFMAKSFCDFGVRSVAVHGETLTTDREKSLRDLATGEIKVIFSVDIFNEGVDIPSVDTLLLLRPTDSGTLFLQQLGRGLRKTNNKLFCTVLDFVGTHRKEFRFDKRLSAILGGSRKSLIHQINESFPYLPVGCHMELDQVAKSKVLDNIKHSIPDRWSLKVIELRNQLASGLAPTLESFLDGSGLELEDLYSGNGSCWSKLLEDVGIETRIAGPHELNLRKAIGRVLHVNDEERLNVYIKWVSQTDPPNLKELSIRESRLLRMLVCSICDQVLEKSQSLKDAVDLFWQHPQILSELKEVFVFLLEKVDHLNSPLDNFDEVPLLIHAKYSRIEILAAFGVREEFAKTMAWREGIKWIPEYKVDTFLITIDKSSESFSPTTSYRDYAISDELIHWESQSGTSESSNTGQRYINHKNVGSSVMIFVRETSEQRAFWFLGTANYVSHQSERPMEMQWKLDKKMPGDLYPFFASA